MSTLIATAVALPGLMLTQPASAAVTVGTNISAFPNRDMVVAVGYELGEELTVEVVRNGVVIGTTTGPAVTTPEGVGLEVNHGPLGAPLPGDCWTGVTPDIIGGDVIRVTNAVGAVDTMTVQGMDFTGAPYLDGTNVSVDGTATPGAEPFAVEFRRDKPAPRFRRGPFAPVFSPTSPTTWKATFRPTVGADGVSEEGLTLQQQRDIALNEASWLAVSDQITETTLAELGEPGGVGPGCTGTAEPNNLISGYLEPVNIASRDITLSGTAREGVAGVSVAVGALPAKAATLSTNTTGVKTWTVPVTKAELQTLPDGNIAITPSFDGLPGTTRTMLKDMVAPLAPTATPPAGSYAGTQNVTLNKPAGEASSKTHWEIGSATTVTDPDAASAVYTAQIAVSATQTIKARVIDPAGNLGAVATFAYRIGTPPAVPTGVTATETAGGVRIGWSPVSGAANYNVYRSTSTTTPVNPTPLASTATSYVNTGLANGSYSYVVRSVSNTGVESANSATVTATVAPPTVTTRTPALGAVGASAAGNVTATFNEAMTGVSGTTFTLKTAAGAAVAASVSYNTSTRVATLDPTATLLAGTTYTATLTGGATAIRDAGGNALATTSWTFTTDPGPRVVSTTPYNGATGVGVANNIVATFDEAVTGVSGTTFTLKNAAGTAVAGAVSYNTTTRVATFNPTNNMTLDTRYTATLTSGIRDAAGNPMALRTWTFMAGVAPTVTSRAPLANATGASKTANVTATFSEAVTGVTGTTFTLKNSAGATVSATVTYNSTTRTASLDPAVTLTGSTKYTATLTGGATLIRDLAGNMLGTNSWSFTTAP